MGSLFNSQNFTKMRLTKNFRTQTSNFYRTVIFLVIALTTKNQAATPFEQVEEAVGGGAIYLDLVGIDITYESSSNPGISLTTDAIDWGWPDGSDNSVSVASDGFSGDIFDDKSNPASDFSAFVSGLAPFSRYELYVLNVIKTNSYDFSWSRGRYANIVDVSEEGIGGDSPAIIEENFGEESLTFSDRTHQHNGAAFDLDGNLSTSGSQVINLPDYLVGGNYIRFANNARDNSPYTAEVEADGVTTWYLLVDNRLDGPAGSRNSPNSTDPELGGNLQWIIDDGWVRVNTGISPNGLPDYTGVDEGGDGFGPGQGLNQFYSVYSITAESVTLKGQGIGGSNMMSLVTQGEMITVNNIKNDGVAVVEDNGGEPDSYAISIGYFTSDEDGIINLRLGKGVPNEEGGRTELDGILVVPPADFEIPIQRFLSSEESILPGETIKLNWTISPASTSATISPGNIDALALTGADGKGSIEITPTISSEYTLTVDTPEEEGASESLNIQVSLVGSFFADPALIKSGEETTLNWVVREDATLSISPEIGIVNSENGVGSLQVSPNKTTNYILTASAEGEDDVITELIVNVLSGQTSSGEFAAPTGGWDYGFDGDVDPISDEWDHNNGSDSWDESDFDTGAPGGVALLEEGAETFIRMQDTGNPRSHGFGDPSNRKLYFTKDLTTILSDGYSPLVDGITLNFRARVPVPGNNLPLDDYHADNGTKTDWSETGDGYAVHDGGKGSFTIRDSLSGQTISFALSTETVGPGGDYTSGEGLTMNKLNGTSPSANVDANDGGGEVNVLAIEPRVWNNFWITIEEDINGTGTHKADVYLNGSNTPTSYFLTSGVGNDASYTYIAMGLGATPQSGAVDIDFFNVKEGIEIPRSSTPFQIQEINYTQEGITIAWPSRSGEAFLVERSEDGIFWEEIDDSFPASDEEEMTEFLDEDISDYRVILYRVSRAED